MGEALLVGKTAKNRPETGKDAAGRTTYQPFVRWVEELFPGLDMKNDVPAALWLVTEFPHHEEKMLPPGMTHPRNIREWFNEQAQEANLPEDLKAIEKPAPAAPVLAPEDAEKVVKLLHRSRTGDEGSPIAQRMVKGNSSSTETVPLQDRMGSPGVFDSLPLPG